MTDEFDFRTYDRHRSTVGPFTVEAVPVVHPVEAYGLRVSGGRRPRSPTPATPAPCEAARPAGRRRRPAAGRGVVPRRATTTRRGIHLTGTDGGALAARGRGRPAGHHPRAAVVRQAAACSPRRRRSGTARPSCARAGATYERRSRAVRPGRRRGRRSRSAPGWSPAACRRAGTRAPSRSAPTGAARAAISALVRPRPTASATSCSRSVSTPSRQPRDLAPVVARVVADPLDQGPGHRRGQHRVAVGDRPDRLEDLRRGSVLEQEPVRPRGQRPDHVLVRVERGQHDHVRRVRPLRAAPGWPPARSSAASGCP